ESH
ncbi:RNA polymerase Rpb1, domain 1 family protein, partial [Vibrio parahaemolyticus VPTS-2010]